MTTKVCNNCKTEKSIALFYLKRGTKDGYYGICKTCCADKTKAGPLTDEDRERIKREREAKKEDARRIQVKICKKCNLTKDVNEFGVNNHLTDGRISHCKECEKKKG